MKTRIFICSSALQVLNSRSILDYLDATAGRDFILMVHPLLTPSAKHQIKKVSDVLGFSKVLDLTEFNSQIGCEKVSNPGNIFKLQKEKITSNFKKIEAIKQFFYANIGHVDEVFFRVNYAEPEVLYLLALEGDVLRYPIEDGEFDYLPVMWWLRSGETYQVKRTVEGKIRNIGSFFVNLALTRNYDYAKRKSMLARYSSAEQFSNLRKKKRIYLGEQFKRNLALMSRREGKNSNIKVIILGALVVVEGFQFSLGREIEIYNQFIKMITERFSVGNHEIWYKPHPRADFSSWSIKKEQLNCSVFGYQEARLAEIIMMGESVVAVASVGSTTLLYASELFDLSVVLIDLSAEKVHPLLRNFQKFHVKHRKIEVWKPFG